MHKIKIERLPSVRPRDPKHKPVATRDGVFTTGYLEWLAQDLRAWVMEADNPLPQFTALSSTHFARNYENMFDQEAYGEGLERLLIALYPPQPHLFVVDPAQYCAPRYARVRLCRKAEEEWRYWPGELITEGEWGSYGGFRGPLNEKDWRGDPARREIKKELLIMTAYLLARAGLRTGYSSLLFFTAPGWPLALRVR